MEPWSLAVPDWRDRIRTGQSLLPDLPNLDQAQASRAIAIFNKLRLPDVIGTPALAEAGADWFREIVGALHGSFDLVARERMIREIFLLAPKKSSKTSYAAALMVTTVRLAEAKSPIAYGAVLVSAIVLVGFAIMLWLVIREEVPANQRDMVTLLLGTLAGMASSVVAYWVGSSNGSMQKNAALEKVLAQK
jgi:hypothetical protein